MITVLCLLLIFLFLIIFRCPLALAMLISSIAILGIFGDQSLTIIPGRITSGLDSFPLLAIPLFILAGSLMNMSGLSRRIFRFASSLFGHIKGGLGHVNVVASIIFAGMSGTAMADAAGLGQIEIKAMVDEGYDPAASAAVTSASCVIGPIIPPSVIMIVYAVLSETSVGHLFAGGLIPGLILGILLMGFIYFGTSLKIYDFPPKKRATPKEIWASFKAAFFPLLAPVIILGGILAGVTTPTEAGILGVIYALILGLVYKEFTVRQIPRLVFDTVLANGNIMFVISAAYIFSWIITGNDLGGTLASELQKITDERWIALLFINLGIFIMGFFIEGIAILIITVPVLVPIAKTYGIDLVHLGIIVSINAMIGLNTPPVGLALYVVAGIANVPMFQVFRKVLFLLIPLLIGLVIITYYEPITLWFPRIIFK